MMNMGSSSQREKSSYRGLIDVVFTWTLEDVCNEELYKDEVKRIPESFQSVGHYFASYVFPLIEDTRAKLYSSVEVISEAPWAEVISLEASGSFLYYFKVDSWRNRFGAGRKEPYKPLPGDVFVLSDAVPGNFSDLQRYGRTWIFASVTEVPEYEHMTSDSTGAEDYEVPTYFKVRTSKAIDFEEGMRKSVFAVFLINITTNVKIWKALHKLGNTKVIEEVLCANSVDEEICNLCSSSQIGITWAKRLGPRLSSMLNESQTAAVLGSICTMQCNHKSTVKLVWGPPGTGKTKTVSTLLWTLLETKCRALACAPTNVAITVVATRVLDLVKAPYELDPCKGILLCSLGDLLLFGNNERLKVGGDLEEIFLDYRVDRLIECFAPLTGWATCFTSMIDFVENCVSQYHIYLGNKMGKESEVGEEKENSKGVELSFVKFTRKQYSDIILPLRKCVRILCTHLPLSVILQHNFQSMVSLLGMLESFGSLLSQDDMVDKELEEIFALPEVMENESHLSMHTLGCEEVKYCTLTLLAKTRNECLSVLRSLLHSLNSLDLPNGMNKSVVREFCFQNASLYFCTACSSYKLHSVEIEPLDFLIIDEAAQLKECESAIPLQHTGIRHAILFGDEYQLPAMVNSKVSDEAGFGRSLFERLSLLGHQKHLLNMQYRMHPKISSFPNDKFYLNKILDAPNVRSQSYERQYLPGPMFGPYSFIDISYGKEEFDCVGHSRKNWVEVAVVMKILQNLFQAWNGLRTKLIVTKVSIGIVSPYTAQVAAIQKKLSKKYEKFKDFAVRVKSIDESQGGEEDIIIISTVRSNSGGSIGFLSSQQRTNVALTRAKHCLWILGNGTTLVHSGSIWAELVINAKDRQCFFHVDENKDLAKAIVQVKKELDQLDDLLKSDSILFKNAMWKVLFSDNFRKSFRNLKSTQTQKLIINLLLRLSSGWRPKKRNVNPVCESSLLVKQFKVEDLYLICAVDIMKESMYVQVLKIWDILPLEEVPRLLKRLDSIFGMYTDDFASHCKMKRIEGDLEMPMAWETCVDIVRYKKLSRTEAGNDSSSGTFDGKSYIETSKVSESLSLMKFYSLSSGLVGHLLSGRDGREIDLLFEVTDQELEIILFPRSTFILGRSGTGKTTVLTKKLIQKEQLYYISSEGFCEVKSDMCMDVRKEIVESLGETKGTILRQMFVTVSPKLCSAVKNHISHLKSLTCGDNFSAEFSSIDMVDIDDTAQFRDIPDRFIDIPLKSYPLVITFRKFLMMLDGSMENSYFDRFHNVWGLSLGKSGISRSIALQAFIRTKEVSYDRFDSSYWPHFNSQKIKKLDSSTVFTQIISHIKGGLKCGQVCDGKLSREDYILLSEGRVSTLNRERREIIYDIFLDYEKKKQVNREFDLADLVIDLHCRMRDGSYDGEQMDFVYIDEVQDLTMRQIALFKYICRNFNEGFVFSGDTAQTIGRGIDFRFQDIKSLFYKEFLLESGSDVKDNTKEKCPPRISDIFHLTQNFRTHAGVHKLSQSVIDLLYRFFPLSIDVLSPETSLIYGEAPVLLESGNDENAIITIFGNSGNNSGSMVGFGAEQVILVRDDDARKEISRHVGRQALVLTILECKGLEFQDVLLYNFFGTSPMKNQWRVINEYMKEQDMLDSTAPKFPIFNEAKHNILCSELKQLYVAITRTRQRLWICENVEDFSKPMFDYWKKLCFVQVRLLDESLAQAMQVASSKEEWSSRGIKLFNEGSFEMASMSFERAGDLYKEKWARAAGLRASAQRLRGSSSDLARIALTEAASIFETIGKAEIAAKCFIELKEYKRAGTIYLEKCGESRIEDAGDCFSLAECWSLAAEVYAKGNNFLKCLSVCTKGNLFDMGLNFIKFWKGNADSNVDMVLKSKEFKEMEQAFVESCALHYHELKDIATMMKFVRAFHSMDSRRTFLRSRDCLDELMLLEEESGNFLEAASIARLKGHLLLEADILGKGGYFKDASSLILLYVLGNSLWENGSKGWPLKQFTNKEELLMKAKMIAKNKSDLFYEFVCTESNILSNQEVSLLHLGESLNTSQRLKNLRAEIISAWKILDFHLQLLPPKYEWEHEVILNPLKHANDMISHNRASIESLLYFWNLWREKIIKIFGYLQSLGTPHGKEYMTYGEFCMGFLGVRKQKFNQGTIYLLLKTDAYWKKEINDRTLCRNGGLAGMDVHQFVSAAQNYWVSEVLSVGMKVLETLESLHMFSVRNSLSLFCQGMSVLHIFEVTKHLMDSKIPDWKFHAWAVQKLHKFFASSRVYFFDIVFPLDWRRTTTENMISLRGTDLYRDLLEEVIIENINSKGKVTYGRIGRVVMLSFVSGKLTDKLYQMIAKCFDVNPSWKLFIEQLKEHLVSGLRQISLAKNLQEALRETFSTDWRKERDYISPHCYIYLLERLLFLVSSCQGSFFTTKSSLIETLACEKWTEKPCTSLVTDIHKILGGFYDFIIGVIQEVLFNWKDTFEWLEKSNISAKQYYPLLVLRSVVLISLICLNSGNHFGFLSNLLGRNDIISHLPRAFYEILQGRGKRDFVNVLAEALLTIENPLVILGSGNNRLQFYCPDALSIDMDMIRCRGDIVGVLFPKNIEDTHIQVNSAGLEINNSSTGNLSLCTSDKGSIVKLPPSSDFAQKRNDIVEENENENRELQKSNRNFWVTFDDAGSPTFNTPQLKVKVEESIHVLDAAITKLNQNRPSGNEDGNLSGEVENMLDELKKLLIGLNVRGRRPGIYNTWEECNAQVNGFSGCVFKSFSTLEEATMALRRYTTNEEVERVVKNNLVDEGEETNETQLSANEEVEHVVEKNLTDEGEETNETQVPANEEVERVEKNLTDEGEETNETQLPANEEVEHVVEKKLTDEGDTANEIQLHLPNKSTSSVDAGHRNWVNVLGIGVAVVAMFCFQKR